MSQLLNAPSDDPDCGHMQSMPAPAVSDMAVALHHAAQRGELQILYQPVADLETGSISSMEALLRWNSADFGVVLPATLIPIAQACGAIDSIGLWVLRTVCQDIRTLLDRGLAVPPVAVNISPGQFRDPELVQHVQRSLNDFRIDPELMHIEVTESTLMDDVHRCLTTLQALKQLGLKLSLDDFGTGYSSLSHLKRYPFNKVKIDQSFVQDTASNQVDVVTVNVIVAMAHGLGLSVIAEGVETHAQCEAMRSSACDEIQGHFFSRPVELEALQALLRDGLQLPAQLRRFRARTRTLLLVDDEPNVLASLKRLFRRDGYIIHTANGGAEGLELLAREKVDVIMSDQRMPGMSGVEFLRTAKIQYPETIRIVLSGYAELQYVTQAINEGAIYRFLTKPWDDDQLREQLQRAFEHSELQEKNQQLDIKIRASNRDLVAINRQLNEALETNRKQIDQDEVSLAIAREALQYVPLPILGIDDSGLIIFVNQATETLFSGSGPLLGTELAVAVPAIADVLQRVAEGQVASVSVDDHDHRVIWHKIGKASRSEGKLVLVSGLGPWS